MMEEQDHLSYASTHSKTSLPEKLEDDVTTEKNFKYEKASSPLNQKASKEELLRSFRWFGWGPAKDSLLANALEERFPGAIPSTALVHRAVTVLREFDVSKENTIFGTSICCDEINNEDRDMAQLFRSHFGQVFALGGLGGGPFVGATGFSAFSHHVPDNGNIFILFGPHCGLTNEGQVGKYTRLGQCHASNCCGAVTAAFDQLNDNKVPNLEQKSDMQMTWWRDMLRPKLSSIKTAQCSQTALASAAYEIVANAIEEIIHTKFGSGKLVLIGGILLNLPEPLEDHLQPRFFQIRQKNQAPIDLLAQLSLTS